MNKVYSFNFNAGGFRIAINVIGNDIGEASKKAFARCADNVGDNFKKKALNGDYLKSIDVMHNID